MLGMQDHVDVHQPHRRSTCRLAGEHLQEIGGMRKTRIGCGRLAPPSAMLFVPALVVREGQPLYLAQSASAPRARMPVSPPTAVNSEPAAI